MAFDSASGWGNLPNGNFSPVIYSQKVLKFFKKISVVDEVGNTDFAGEIANFGDSVKIIKQPEISGGTYTRGQKLTSDTLIDDVETLTVDQAHYFQFLLDDIENAHSHVSYEDMAVDSGAYYLKDQYDQNVLAEMVAGAGLTVGSSGSAQDVGFGASDMSPTQLLNRMSRKLDENNVPKTGRYFIGNPAFYEALFDDDSKLLDAQVVGQDPSALINENLKLSRTVHGFAMLESNNTPIDGGDDVFLAGHVSAVTTAKSILKQEHLRNPDSFGDIHRGLFVWGREVIRPEALCKAYVQLTTD